MVADSVSSCQLLSHLRTYILPYNNKELKQEKNTYLFLGQEFLKDLCMKTYTCFAIPHMYSTLKPTCYISQRKTTNLFKNY